MKILPYIVLFAWCSVFSQIPPAAKKIPVLFKKHGYQYTDDYAWMERMRSPETESWVEAQNKNTEAFINSLNTKAIANKISEYRAFSSTALPVKKGRYFYNKYRFDNNKPSVLVYRKKLADVQFTILVDPYKIYNDAKTTVAAYFPSDNSRWLAYALKTDGSDRNEIRFRNIDQSTDSPEILKNIRLTNVEWKNDEGIFYKRNANADFFERDSTFQLYYHSIGQTQENDRLIYDTTASEPHSISG